MNKKSSITLASAIAALAISGSAGATVINYGSQLDGDNVPTTTVAGANVINFNDGTCAPASCSGTNYAIVNGSTNGHNAAPAIPPYNGSSFDPTNYLTVPDNLSATPQSTTISLGSGNHYFGLLWGSIDAYNTLTFMLDDNTTLSYTGSDIINPSPANGNQASPTTNTYVNFFQLPAFNAVKLSSTQYAFESDNLAYSDVPEPGNLALFGLAALGLLVGFRRRFSGRAF
ncbi:Npun_F0296 family exosortase-dependent surface protein [Salinisphaera hydrothermalis]|uniref:Npun_F0296 family exosortase-dependent surface protein n=1 Tax=Salinisphaera hydrothermalis TaxID=563188 RepID=UPI00333FFB05